MSENCEIAVITPYFPTVASRYSGTFVYDQIVALDDLVASVTVYLLKPWFRISRKFPFVAVRTDDFRPERPRSPTIRVEVVRYFPFPKDTVLYHLSMLLSLLSIRSRLPVVVIAHTIYPVGVAASLLGKRPTVITHGSDYRYFIQNRRQRERIRQLIARERVVCVSEGLRTELLAEQVDGANIRLVENGIPLLAEVRGSAMSTPPEFRFVYVGSLIKAKGVYELLEAFGSLADTVSCPTSLTIIGDGVERGSLEEIARGMPGCSVEFLGALDNDQVRGALADYQCLVLPSYKEGFGRVIVEMFSAGRPVIATVSGGPEYLVDKSTGLLVAPRDPAALSNAMQDMVENYARYDPQDLVDVVKRRFEINIQTRRLLGVALEGRA